MDKENLVGIYCITYNHKSYIRDCLEGFVKQKTNFKFKAVVFDDCSTDGTREIVEEYAKKYPDIIKPILPEHNVAQSKGFDFVAKAIYDNLNTKYVAYCEGDDYWTDENKLQKQVDFLEAHPEYSGCFHPVKIHWENGEEKDSIYPKPQKIRGKKFVTAGDLLEYNYIQTNSVLYRWAFIDKDFKEFFPEKILPGDLYMHLLHAKRGNIGFLPEVMSVYRRQRGGIWFNNPRLKYGKEIVKFYYEVWKNITDSSEDYLHDKFLPALKESADVFYKNGKLEELKELQDTYGEYFEKALSDRGGNPKKDIKYKKLFNITLIISVIELILLIILMCSSL